MLRPTIALFGEAERGEYRRPYLCNSVEQLALFLGNPPEQSQGLFFAIQALLYERDILFFRVAEEGFSKKDYFSGMYTLQSESSLPDLAALCLPGVGDHEVIDAGITVCHQRKSILLTTSSDLYDYLTSSLGI